MSSENILVTAATGNVGTPLVKALQEKEMSFTAGTRDAENAREQLGSSVDTVYLDYEDSSTFGPALDGKELLFLCGPSATPDAPDLLMPMIEEARERDIRHIVFIASHPTVMEAIQDSGIDYTFLQANFFMQNFELYQTDDIRDRNQIFLPCGEGKASFIHCRDIGEVAAEVLEHPGEFRGHELSITGGESLDLFEAASIFSEVLDRSIEYKNPDDEMYRSEMEDRGRTESYIEAMIKVFGMIEQGIAAETSSTVEEILGRPPLTLCDYVSEQEAVFRK